MTNQIQIGDTLTLPGGRMTYTGEGRCDVAIFHPERSSTGGRTNSGKGEWIVTRRNVPMTPAQIAEWPAMQVKYATLATKGE